MNKVIDFYNAKNRLRFDIKQHPMCSFQKGTFEIVNINKEGYVEYKLLNKEQIYKVLVNPSLISKYKIGEKKRMMLSKKVFFVYWDIVYYY